MLHASYAMNPASIDEDKRQNAVRIIKEDLSVLASMNGNKKYVIHPGSATDCYRTEALMQLVKTMYDVFPFVPKNTTICLEFMAGQGTQLLSSLMEIKALADLFSVCKVEAVTQIDLSRDFCFMAKTDEELAAEELAQAKAERADAVSKITVTVDGMVFDGDETAQERMSRAVVLADSMDETTEWVLHDNTVAIVTADQLRRACKLAGKAQTALWTVPYESK